MLLILIQLELLGRNQAGVSVSLDEALLQKSYFHWDVVDLLNIFQKECVSTLRGSCSLNDPLRRSDELVDVFRWRFTYAWLARVYAALQCHLPSPRFCKTVLALRSLYGSRGLVVAFARALPLFAGIFPTSAQILPALVPLIVTSVLCAQLTVRLCVRSKINKWIEKWILDSVSGIWGIFSQNLGNTVHTHYFHLFSIFWKHSRNSDITSSTLTVKMADITGKKKYLKILFLD